MQNKTLKKKLVLKDNIKILLNKILITIIIFLIGMIAVKTSPTIKVSLQKNI